MKDTFVVVIWIDDVPTILGSFVDQHRAINRAMEEIIRAERIYAREKFATIGAVVDRVWHMQNASQDRVIVIKVQHDETTTTPE